MGHHFRKEFMVQEKLPVETPALTAALSKEQLNSIITWYFKNFLNKNVTGVAYSCYNSEVNSVTVRCTDAETPKPTRTVEQIKKAVTPSQIEID